MDSPEINGYGKKNIDYNKKLIDIIKNPNQIDDKLIDLYADNILHYCVDSEKKKINSIENIVEAELRTFQNVNEFGGISNTLNKYQFENIIKHLKYNLNIEILNPEHSLDISIHSNNNVNRSDELSKLRFTILGKENIMRYCKTNKIPERCNLIYKEKLNWNTDELEQRIYNIDEKNQYASQFNHPEYNKLINSLGRVDLFSTKIRLDGKLELPYDYDTRDFKVINNTNIINHQEKANFIYQKYKSLNEVWKSYRLKERYSFTIDSNIRVDLTKVKTSKKDIDYNYKYNIIPVRKFIDSEIAEQSETYEFEIEFIKLENIPDKNVFIEKISKAINFVKHIYSIINERDGYTYFNIEKDVLTLYKECVKKIMLQRIDTKISICNDCIQLKNNTNLTQLHKKYENSKYPYFNIISKDSIHSIKLKMSRLENQKMNIIKDIENNNLDTLFISPKVVSIGMDDIRSDNPNSILEKYCVTDKADGSSSILFKIGLENFDSSFHSKFKYLENKIFLIDNNLNIHDIQIELNQPQVSEFEGCFIMNGEFLNYDINKNPINRIGIYDTYYYNDQDICSLPLISLDNNLDTRIKKGTEFISWIHSNLKENLNNFSIFMKKFYVATEKQNIFNCTKIIWDNYQKGNIDYYLDGTIYTPIDEPVSYNEDKIDYNLKQGVTWNRNLKWKPPDDNTIDFLIRFEKQAINEFNKKKIYKNKIKNIQNSDTISFQEFFMINFYNTGREILKKNDPCNIMSNNEYGKTIPIKFDPDDENASILFKVHKNISTNKTFILDENNNKVEDDTIVEVKYTDFIPSDVLYQPDKRRRFKIIRTRYDKTYMHRISSEYQKESFKIIMSIFSLIEQHINGYKLDSRQISFINDNISKIYSRFELKKMSKRNYIDILKKDLQKKKKEFKNYSDINNLKPGMKLNYGNSENVAKNIWNSIHNPITSKMITTGEDIPDISIDENRYYNQKKNYRRDKSFTIALQDFHNKIIKNRILLNNAVNILRLNDSNKKIHLLDLACGKGGDIGKWIDNKIDVCIGIDLFDNNINNNKDGACERYNFYKKKPIFSKNSANKLPFVDFLVGDISKNLYDNSAFNSQIYKNKFNELWFNSSFKFGENKFNIISIMFALHYFFKDINSLDNLITNINQNLNDDGLLIGACFDGKLIFDMLENCLINESVEGYSHGTWIWKIIKNYQKGEFNEDESSLNTSIKVVMKSINKIIEEYLVNFNYFISKLDSVGITHVEQSLLEHENIVLPKINAIKLNTGIFKDVFDINLQGIKNPSIKEIISNLRKDMSESEKKISFLNRYFIFKKK